MHKQFRGMHFYAFKYLRLNSKINEIEMFTSLCNTLFVLVFYHVVIIYNNYIMM